MAVSLEKLKNIDFNQIQEDLNNFDPKDLKYIGTAPLLIRILLITIVLTLIIFGSYKFIVQPQIDVLAKAKAKEEKLKQLFSTKQKKATKLEAYKEQLDEMERSFGAMLRQLPDKTDVESLVIDLSQTAARNNLKVEYLKPEAEITKEFYAELPISLRVFGQFHELANFISNVAALPRIVTLHDINIKPIDTQKPTELTMEMTARTYRYLEE